jgi:Aminoglycoside-2''-adenylyltransferase
LDNENTVIQLRLIGEITRLLSTSGIAHWLVGGWAIDFLNGSITRSHDDLDWSIWERDALTVYTILINAHYQPREVPYPDEAQWYSKYGQNITVFFLQENEKGQVGNPRRLPDCPWPPDSFNPLRRACLDGIVCPVVSIEGQLDLKENQPGGPHLPKDVADVVLLRRLLQKDKNRIQNKI